jgi:protein-S-isoprenylcysteine O-methyltransferase Ste14
MSETEKIQIKFLKLSVYTPTLFLVAIGFALLFFRLYPVRISYHLTIVTSIGIGLFIIGTILVILAERSRHNLFHFSEGLTCYDFSVGVYNHSRHPGTLGFLMLFLGFAFLLNSQAILITVFLHFLLLSLVFIPLIEREIEQNCGNPYKEYKKIVRMWI